MSDEAVQFRDAIRSLNTTLKTREAKIASLEREHDALREALEQIAKSGEYTTGDGHAQCVAIARAALEAKPL